MSNINTESNYIVDGTNNKVYIHIATFEDTKNYKFLSADSSVGYSNYVCEIPQGNYSNWETLMTAFVDTLKNRTGVSFTCIKNSDYNDYTLTSNNGKGFVLTYGPNGIQGLNFFANYPFLLVEEALVNKAKGSFVQHSVTFADHTELAIIVKDPNGNQQGWGSNLVVNCNGVTNNLAEFDFGSYTLEKAVASISKECSDNFPDNPPVAKITTCGDIAILRISNIDEIWFPTSVAKAFGLDTISSEGIKKLDSFSYLNKYTNYNISYYSATSLIKNRTIGFAFKHVNHEIGNFNFEEKNTDISIPGTTGVLMPLAIANLVRDTINGTVQQTVSGRYDYNSSNNVVYISLNKEIVDTYGLTINNIEDVNYRLTPVINSSNCKINLEWLADTILYRTYIYDSYGDYVLNNAIYDSSTCIFGYCEENVLEGVTWGKTPMGKYVWEKCPVGFTSSMKRECSLKGSWLDVDMSTCIPVCLKDGPWVETEQGKTVELTETDKHSGDTISRRCSYPSETGGVSQWQDIEFPNGTGNIVCKNFDNIEGVSATVPFGETVTYSLIEESDNKEIYNKTYSITCDKEGLAKGSSTLTGAVRYCPANNELGIKTSGIADVPVQCPNDSSKNIIYTCDAKADYTWKVKEDQCKAAIIVWFMEKWQHLWFKIVVILIAVVIVVIFVFIIRYFFSS